MSIDECWTQLQHWNTDDELDTWLKQQGLQNSQTIINKLAFGEELVFAKGTRRLRYAANKFYLDKAVPISLGVGKDFDVATLRIRLQTIAGLVEKVHIEVDNKAKFTVDILETDVWDKPLYHIRLNPLRLTTPAKIHTMVADLERQLKR
ncbi:MAG: hypothetical protein KAJ19_10060 [Gammaproteobacteria bacterium]|nr:hypothetical protein [Gammaproteobacteria bacterium]